MDYISTGMGDCFSGLLMSLMALGLTLVVLALCQLPLQDQCIGQFAQTD